MFGGGGEIYCERQGKEESAIVWKGRAGDRKKRTPLSSGEDLLLILLSKKMNKREEKQGFTSLKKIQHEPLPCSVDRHFTVGKHSGLVCLQRRPENVLDSKDRSIR